MIEKSAYMRKVIRFIYEYRALCGCHCVDSTYGCVCPTHGELAVTHVVLRAHMQL